MERQKGVKRFKDHRKEALFGKFIHEINKLNVFSVFKIKKKLQ